MGVLLVTFGGHEQRVINRSAVFYRDLMMASTTETRRGYQDFALACQGSRVAPSPTGLADRHIFSCRGEPNASYDTFS